MKRLLPTTDWRALGMAAVLAAHAVPGLADEMATAPMVEPQHDGVALADAHAPVARTPAPNAVSALALQGEDIGDATAAHRDTVVAAPVPPSPRWSTSAQLVGDAYRFSLARGSLDLGMSFDT